MLFKSLELNPYKFNLFVIDKPFATAIDVLIPENLPGPWFTNKWLILLKLILFLFKKSNNKIENFS